MQSPLIVSKNGDLSGVGGILFKGREKEIAQITSTLAQRNHSGNLLVYGSRRVGKTTLLGEVLKDYPGTVIWYECIKGSLDYNIELCAKSASVALGKPYLSRVRDLFDLFQMISETGRGGIG